MNSLRFATQSAKLSRLVAKTRSKKNKSQQRERNRAPGAASASGESVEISAVTSADAVQESAEGQESASQNPSLGTPASIVRSIPPDAGRTAEVESLPRFFGDYHLFDRIGHGGMANIYLAVIRNDTTHNTPDQPSSLVQRRVVVKKILQAISRDEHFTRLFVEEAKLSALLSHKNIVRVEELGKIDDSLFMMMEYIEGVDLHQFLSRLSKKRMALPFEFALHIASELLSGLHFAHRARDAKGKLLGIVHRDVSPTNVLLSVEGEVKLCDFGIATAVEKRRDENNDLSDHVRTELEARVMGKSGYMSPEQARGDDLDARSDVYAAGVLLWELSAGRRMLKGAEHQVLEWAKEGMVPEFPHRELPHQDQFEALLARALHKDVAERFASADEMHVALRDYMNAIGSFSSALRFSEFVAEVLGPEFVQTRRHRERAAAALALGPPLTMAVIEAAPSTNSAVPVSASRERPSAHLESSSEIQVPMAGSKKSMLIVLALMLAAGALIFFLMKK